MHEELRNVKFIEKYFDNLIKLPGGYRIGLDGIIGFIPVVGDFFSTSISSYIIYKAIKLKAPKLLVTRMLVNVLIDTTLGAIPIIGDLFDFIWKANERNRKLLQKHIESPRVIEKENKMKLLLISGLALIIIITFIWLVIKFISFLL